MTSRRGYLTCQLVNGPPCCDLCVFQDPGLPCGLVLDMVRGDDSSLKAVGVA